MDLNYLKSKLSSMLNKKPGGVLGLTSPSNSRRNFRMIMLSSSSAALYRGLRHVKIPNKALQHVSGRRFYCRGVQEVVVDVGQVEKFVKTPGSSFWGWLRNHKWLGFTVIFTVTFGGLQWIPVSNRIHMVMSTDKVENLLGCLAWEKCARRNQGLILSPESPQSIRVARVLREILQATNQVLGLKNDFQVSVYEPRNEAPAMMVSEDDAPNPFTLADFSSLYHRSNSNKRVQNKPREARKFGVKYGTEHFDGLNWEVMVVPSYIENAGYISDGRIIFYTGYFTFPDFTDTDLATVLAHEVGHGLARHPSETLLTAFWILALVILPLSCFLCVDFWTIGAIVATIASFNSRRMELEADRIGMMLMAAAGYDPRRAPELLAKYGGIETPFMTATHPSGQTRAKKLRRVRAMRKAEEVYNQVRAGQQIKTFI